MRSAMRTIISKSELNAGAVGCFFDLLDVAVVVGDGAGFFVEVGGREDDVGEHGGLRHEHVLHDDEGVLERGCFDAVTQDGVRADDVERRETSLRLAASKISSMSLPGAWQEQFMYSAKEF